MIDTVVRVAAAVLPVVALAPWASSAGAGTPRQGSPGGGDVRRAGRRDRRRWPVRSDRTVARPPGSPRRPIGPRLGPILGVAMVGAAVAGVVASGVPIPAVAAGGVIVAAGRMRSVAAARRRAQREVARDAPDLVDLLAVAAAAGHPAHRCLHAVAERAPPSVRDPVRSTCRRIDRGVPLAVAVDDVRRGLGWLGDPVADALVDAFRTGAPLQPALGRVVAVARDRRRREAEAEARRLPVLLLFPLVCCILPAFGLLAVVPLVAASVRSLG